MAPVYEDDTSKVSARRTLRALNSVAALCGLILNTVTLTIERAGDHGNAVTQLTSAAYVPIVVSIVWNHLDSRGRLPEGLKWVAMVVDAGMSLGFLALVIASGFIIRDLDFIDNWRVMLLTYNTMPWIICDVLHLFFALQVFKKLIGFNPTWRFLQPCSECQHRMLNTPGRSVDGAKYRLLDDQMEDDDVEDSRGQASRQAKGPIHLADDV